MSYTPILAGPNNHKTLLLLLSVLLYLSPTPANAFKPDGVHRSITGAAISGITELVDGQSITFSDEAVREILSANASVDISRITVPIFSIIPRPSGDFWIPSNHFDNEELVSSSERLLTLRQEVVAAAQRQSGIDAQILLGRALHTLQDFYAHSNWIEIGNIGIPFDALGVSRLPTNPPKDQPFCPNSPSVLEGDGLQGLTTGYFHLPNFKSIFESGFSEKVCGPLPAGKCYHGLSFGCKGINKDNPFESANHAVARSLALEHTRNYVQLILGDLRAGPNPAESIRSLMGVPGASLVFVIDKTMSMTRYMPLVRDSVMRIINQGLSQVPGFRPVEFILVLFGDPEIDPPVVTRSGGELIELVNRITLVSGGDDCPELVIGGLLQGLRAAKKNSVLVLYTDSPSAKDENQFPAFEALQKEKNVPKEHFLIAKYPTIGCPSLEITSGEAGIPSSRSFVDQTQSSKQRTVSRTDGETNNTNRLTLLRNLVEESGEFFDLRLPSDAIEIDKLLPVLASADLVTILRTEGNPADPAGQRQEFAVPVDSAVKLLSVFVSGDKIKSVELKRPSGTQVRRSDRGVSFAELSSGTLIALEAPEPGMWRLSVSASGNFTIKAQANSPIQLVSFDFGVLVTDPVDLGFVPLPGHPVVGSTLAARAEMIGPFATVDFRLLDESGQILQTIDLRQGNPDVDADDFLGSFPLPSVPFRVAVSGFDTNGQPYERLLSTLFRVQSIEVAIDPTTANDRVAFGTARTFRARVGNLGEPTSLQLQAVATMGTVDAVRPDVLTLGTGQVGNFDITVVIPADVAEGTEILLTATAASITEPTLRNSSTLHLTASQTDNLLPVADAGPDQIARVGRSVTLDATSSFDPDNGPAPLSFSWMQLGGPTAVILTRENTARPSFIPKAAGNYRFSVIVSDGEVESVSNDVTVVVLPDIDPAK